MKLVSFKKDGARGIGVLDGEAVIDLARAAPELPQTMTDLLDAGPDALGKVRAAVETAAGRIPLASVELLAPVDRPRKILACGLNYRDHIAETGRDAPEVPMIFNKQATSANGPFAPIFLPPESIALDYEGELGVVIGQLCRRVPRDRAGEVIAGYLIANDVSVRDWQFRSPTQMMGKSWDSHCPMGPALVTPDEIDAGALDLRTYVNGELRQSSNTRELLFDVPFLIEHLSTAFTLEPGDVILTGTPSGVAAAMKGQRWLREGDRVRIEIEGLGAIENTVVVEPGGVRIGV